MKQDAQVRPQPGERRLSFRPGVAGWYVLGCLVLGLTACGRKADTPETPAAPGRMATQGGSAEATSTYADPQLAELTRELRRWIVRTKQRPASFEEFAAAAQINVPTPPPGKRFALSPEMRVILVDH